MVKENLEPMGKVSFIKGNLIYSVNFQYKSKNEEFTNLNIKK